MDKDVTIRKRTQIKKISRMMFIWVAGASIILGLAIAGIILLIQIIMFNENVLAEKSKTVAILIENNNIIPKLKSQVRALDANKDLMDSRANPTSDQALQVILDALPSNYNELALGSSLQGRLLNGIEGLNLLMMSTNDNSDISSAPTASDGLNSVQFNFKVSGPPSAIQQVFEKIEKSIRTFEVISFKMDGQGSSSLTLSVQGRAFFEPERTIGLKEITVK